MPAVSFSQLESIVRRARETQSQENKDAAVNALLSFALAVNPKQRIKASTLLPEFHEISAHRQSHIHEAIFDLCEDPLEHVRIAGYHAIVDLSRRASSVRRKNADVLCQLLQSEGASELAVVRGCLSQHVRIAPATTYNIIAEYLVTSNGTTYARGPLMGVILSFLDGGGLGHSWIDSAISSNEAIAAFAQRDIEGGKGALLEVSWLQKDTAADAILRKSLLAALSFATLEEARTITSSILYSLYSECMPVGKDATDLLHSITQIASKHFKEEINETPTTMSNTLDWLNLGVSAVSPPISPVPSFEAEPALPRADPSPLLTAFHEWILTKMWNKYSQEVQMHLTLILGAALGASRAILNSGRRAKDEHQVQLIPTLIKARDDIIDHADQVMQSWIEYTAYNGDDQVCQAMLELICSISERKADSKWTPTFDQSIRLQNLRKSALKYAGGAGFNQFRELLQRIDTTLACPREVAPTDLITIGVPSPISPVSPTVNIPNNVLSRKRPRSELENTFTSGQRNTLGDERDVKRKKVVQPDVLSLIKRHRISGVPSGISVTSVDTRIERDPDNSIGGASGSRQVPTQMPPATSGLSIKGAATVKVAEKGNHLPQGPQETPTWKAVSKEPTRPPMIKREASISSAMQTLRIQPTLPSSVNLPSETRPRPSPQSPSELHDSVKRLLLGKSREVASPQEVKQSSFLPKPPPRSSLLDRIQGTNTSLPSPQPQSPATTIFDRVGVTPKIIKGHAGPKNKDHKKKGL